MNPDTLVPALALMAVATRELLWLAAGGILLSNLDELGMDWLWLGLVALRPAPPLPPRPATAAPLAILVPAWDESAVIAAMLGRFLRTQQHDRYRLFVGLYPNDPATAAAIASVSDPRVVPVMVSRPGPTTKADCLNHLWQAVLACEAESGQHYAAIILHDSEDVVHPRELDLFDRWLPKLAMVQVPVLPFIDRDSRWISGHYLDEFAQNHIRDMMVRTRLGLPVPSAGVGTAIRRDAMAVLAEGGAMPFDASSLTEDYEIGHKLHAAGLRGAMVRCRLDGAMVAVQEYFPATLENAVRQKSRWLTGIALNGWDRLGWTGPPASRWMLLRDRKGLFTAALAVLAYALLALILVQLLARALLSHSAGVALPPLVLNQGDPLLMGVLTLNALLLWWRLCWRAAFTSAAHGWREGLRSLPRSITTNMVNALAALRAVERYRQSLASAIITWDKTEHRFPGTEAKG